MRILPCLNSPCTLYSPYHNPLYYPNPQLAFLTTSVAEIKKFEISLFPVKIEFIFWRFKPALNWNQVLADLRRVVKPGYFELRSNTLNSNTSWITKIKKSMWVLPLKWYQCELLSRRVVIKASCYQGELLSRLNVIKASCYQCELLSRLNVISMQDFMQKSMQNYRARLNVATF